MAFEVFYKDYYYDYLTDTLSWQTNGTTQTLRGFSVKITEMESKRLNNALKNRDEEFIISKNDIKGLYKAMRQAFTTQFDRNLMNEVVRFAPVAAPFEDYVVSETGYIMCTPIVEHIKHVGREHYRARKWKIVSSYNDRNGKLAVVLHKARNKKCRVSVKAAKIVYDSFHEKTPKFTRFDYIDGNTQNIALSNLRIKPPKKQDQYRKSNILFY